MTQIPALRFYKGRTTHKRFTPFERAFSYKIFLIDIDIDRLDEAAKSSRFFSINRKNLCVFRRSDHGARADENLRPWAEAEFAKADINLDGGAIRLVTFPRGLLYKFAPISVWYGHGPDGRLRGVIYEVHNTFGEVHNYVAKTENTRSQHSSTKTLHVSPFWDVTGQYRFTLRPLGTHLNLTIDSIVGGERIHMANMKAKAQTANSVSLLRTVIARPFASFGVTLAIHWQALCLWLKGAGYRSKPNPPEKRTTIATPLSTKDTQERAA